MLAELHVADDPATWRSAGFDVADDTTSIGTTTVRFVPGDGGRRGIVAWSFFDVDDGELDGIPTVAPGDPAPPAAHANGAALIDHVVVATPDLDRTDAALAAIGLDRRRVRDVPGTDPVRRQAFYRAGEVILEVVGIAGVSDPGPASLWGFVVVADLRRAAAALGPLLGTVGDAVQPGRSIATVRRDAGLAVPLAFISPDPRYHRHLLDR